MVGKIKLSILYSVVVSGILVLAFILASFYVPLLEMDRENFVMNMTTNKFIITFIFDFVSLAAIALGFASLVQILENTQSSLVDGLLAVARTTSQTAENIQRIEALEAERAKERTKTTSKKKAPAKGAKKKK